ncbi:uncharacterized protein At4g22758-like [Bidens hawaiensis]|uniref:uncharacterized protein At4g22758-like n=1 Tax=Bidens hawaiensis TaxID=980011 RepID=UPI00404A817A
MLSLPFRKIKDRVMKGGSKRMLIKIDVLGSSGPVRFVVDEDAVVAHVIETALKLYAHERRLPVLGTKYSDFFLYTPIAATEALNPREMIGSYGVRNFMLCKKPPQMREITRKRSSGSWRSWFNKTLTLKVTPH